MLDGHYHQYVLPSSNNCGSKRNYNYCIQQLLFEAQLNPLEKNIKKKEKKKKSKSRFHPYETQTSSLITHIFPSRVKQFLKFQMNVEQPREWLV